MAARSDLLSDSATTLATTTTLTNTVYHRIFGRTINGVDTADVDVAFSSSDFQNVQYFPKNDKFAQAVFQETTDRTKLMTCDQLLDLFQNTPNCNVNIFCVADGDFHTYNEDSPDKYYFDPNLRIVCVVAQGSALSFGQGTFFIVSNYDFSSTVGFLQVASWDGERFTYYGRDTLESDPTVSAWTYQGQSWDAFNESLQYLGPFNGHVNGSLVMKELHTPWPHWISSQELASSFANCFSPAVIDALKASSHLWPFVSIVQSAEALETVISSGITMWMTSRSNKDFKDVVKGQNVKIQRWMAHSLLTTTINIECASQDINQTLYDVPWNNFFNFELLKTSPYTDPNNSLMPSGILSATVSKSNYQWAIAQLDLALLQEIDSQGPGQPGPDWQYVPDNDKVILYPGALGGGRETGEANATYFARTAAGEGLAPWTTLTCSYEDVQGLLAFKRVTSMLSDNLLNAILYLDFWNPIYSWRRLVLMQYVPITTTMGDSGFDFEANFVKNITSSPFANTVGEPENLFVAIYGDLQKNDSKLTYSISNLKANVKEYLNTIQDNLKKDKNKVLEYLTLAEARRRLYRPLPLDEFGFTLPFALAYKEPSSLPRYEMTSTGATQPIIPGSRGDLILTSWTGQLSSEDPLVLPVFPSSTSSSDPKPTEAPITALSLPGPAGSLNLCESASKIFQKRKGRCPAMPPKLATAKRSALKASEPRTQAIPLQLSVPSAPTWDDHVKQLFSTPFWVSHDVNIQKEIGFHWIRSMKYYGNQMFGQEFDLSKQEIVQTNVSTIYRHLRSRSMPITDDPIQYWPEDALETLRNWANQGFRTSVKDPIILKTVVPPPVDPPIRIRVRKDLRSLTDAELQLFRARLDDRLQPGVLESKWQELCRLHGEWCLHYQEAFSLWHRAYLRYVEELIDFPIPYWGFTDPACYDPDSPAAGLPQAFLDETYIHPVSKEVKPNPLKYALALDGKSKGGGKWVTRDEVLTKNDRKSTNFAKKVYWFKKYQAQHLNALESSMFSYPENVTTGAGSAFGIPWANIPFFTQDQPRDLYEYENKAFPYKANFDGFFEQVHDNGHGWVGPDMQDNAYTAADPVFLGYHANIDRILDAYLRTHPQSQYTSSFPLRPFTKNATELDYDDPREYVYSTLGDMAKDTKSNGYLYGPPFAGDQDIVAQYLKSKADPGSRKVPAAGGAAVTVLDKADVRSDSSSPPKLPLKPMIVFQDIVCTQGSFTIDVFAKNAASMEADPMGNAEYVGHITRIGMGTTKNLKRCHMHAVTRSLLINDESLAKRIDKEGFEQVVTDLSTGQVISESEWKKWAGFTGRFVIGADVGF